MKLPIMSDRLCKMQHDRQTINKNDKHKQQQKNKQTKRIGEFVYLIVGDVLVVTWTRVVKEQQLIFTGTVRLQVHRLQEDGGDILNTLYGYMSSHHNGSCQHHLVSIQWPLALKQPGSK